MENQAPQRTGQSKSEPVFVVHNVNSNHPGKISTYPAHPQIKSKRIPINIFDRGGYVQQQVYSDAWWPYGVILGAIKP